jgi:mono/diheme cytochrome c family protein
MMRTVAVVLLVIAVGLGLGYWYFAGRGFSAREEPTAVEQMLALRLRALATPPDATGKTNPLPATAETLDAGLEHFADHCAICHGNDGSGKTSLGTGLYPKPPDLRAARTQNLSDGELFYIIENGVRLTGMPAFGAPGSDPNETWPLVTFIRHLPRLTKDELARMEQLNPKSADELRERHDEDEFLKGGSTPGPPRRHTHDQASGS